VLEAEAREHEVQALPAEAADRVAVAWGVPEAVAAGAAAAVEVVAEQGNKSGLFWPGPLRSNSSQNLCELPIVFVQG
jgi:pyruvate/2-oxoacid:ferredoxin oxidoreductase alpha subunit